MYTANITVFQILRESPPAFHPHNLLLWVPSQHDSPVSFLVTSMLKKWQHRKLVSGRYSV
jgi:hypothetical protein